MSFGLVGVCGLELHFQKLLDDLPRIRQVIDIREPPAVGVARAEAIAIVGYAYHRRAETWGPDEFDFIASRRSEVEGFGPRWVDFVSLASGYMLGLLRAGLLTQQECVRFEALLPGFMWLHSPQLAPAEPGAAADGPRL